MDALNGTIKLAGISGLSGLTGDGTASISFVASASDATASMSYMVFTPARDFSGPATFTVSTDDGTASAVSAKTISVSANASSPLLVLPTSRQNAVEDTAAYLNLSTLDLSDPDTNDQLTVTLTVAHGTLTVKSDVSGGLMAADITANGTSSVTLAGTAAVIKASLIDALGVQYMPDPDFNAINSGTVETLNFAVADGVAAHNLSRNLAISVSPVNDPVQVDNGSQTLTENSSVAINHTTALVAIDPEISAAVPTQNNTQIVYRLTSLPIYGYLSLSGNRIGVGSTFTHAQVTSGVLVYTHIATGADQNTDDSFEVSVNDGATPQNDSDTAKVTLHITPVNQAPTAVGSGSVFEGQPRNATSGGVPQSIVGNFISASGGGDPGDATLNVKLTSLSSHGTLFFNGTAIINGVSQNINRALTTADLAGSGFVFAYVDRVGLTYSNDGVDNIISDPFSITVTDGGGGSGAPLSTSSTVVLNIRPVNDDPLWVAASTLSGTVIPDGLDSLPNTSDDYRIVLTPAMLQATDTDSPKTQITFTMTDVPNRGNLLLNGERLNLGSTFTMDDVINGRVVYGQTRAAETGDLDQFKFRVTDNALSLRWNDAGGGFVRQGGIYTGSDADDSLEIKTFTITLASITGTPNNNYGGADPVITVPAPASDLEAVEYLGLNPSADQVGSLTEGGTATLNNDGTVMLRYSAGSVPSTQIVYTLTGFSSNSGAWNGTLKLNDTVLSVYDTFTQEDVDNGLISFTHNGKEDFESCFDFQVSAGGFDSDGSPRVTNGTFTFYITPINDAPTTGGSRSSLIKEASTLAITTSYLSFGDADDATSESYLENDPTVSDGIGENFALNNGTFGATPLLFRIVALPEHGTLKWYNGSTWTDITGTDISNATLFNTSLLTANADTTGLRYIHDGMEDRSDAFEVIALDRWGALSSIATVEIKVTNVNDSPEIAKDPTLTDPPAAGSSPNNIGSGNAINDPLVVVQEGGFSQITNVMLQAYDADSTDQQVQYKITTNTTHGRIAYSTDGSTFSSIGVGSSFSQAQVDDGYIYYVNNGNDPTSTGYPDAPDDMFVFTLADGDKEQTGNQFWIYVKPTNDAPTVTAPAGPIYLDSAVAAYNPVPGFVVGDPDLLVLNPQEQGFMQVTVRLMHADDSAFTEANYTDSSGVSFGYDMATGVTADTVHNGVDDYLVLRGTLTEVNAALAGLTVTFNDDRDDTYQVEVIADDRFRDSAGLIIDNSETIETNLPEANGGPVNQNLNPTPETQTLAILATEPNYYLEINFSLLTGNISKASVSVRASSINDPVTLTGPASRTSYEDQATFIGGGFVVTDAESAAFDLPITVTLSVSAGTIGIGGSGIQNSVTLNGREAVTVAGDNSGNLTLTGRASDIQALLNDTAQGLTYQSPSNGNHDYNDVLDGDITLTLTSNDGNSGTGGDVGSGSVATVKSINIPITIVPVNDAPTVTAGDGIVGIVSGANAVPGFAINDIDNTDGGLLGLTTGESDFVQATIRLLSTDGTTPFDASQYSGIILDSSSLFAGYSTPFHVDSTYSGSGSALVIRGTLANVNDYLAGLRLEITDSSQMNSDTALRVEVIADDRMRDVNTGAFIGNVANGGLNPDGSDAGTLPDNVPNTAIDPYAATPSGLTLNVGSGTRTILPTSINDPATITVNTVSVNEGKATVVLNDSTGNIIIADPDDTGATNLTATVTVPANFTISGVGASGGTVTGTGSSSVTITGTETQINSCLHALTIALPGNNPDWNGSFEVTVEYNDQGNTGVRPASLTGDTNDANANPGDYTYADGDSGAGKALVTIRTFTITVVGENNAPVRTDANPVTLDPTSEDVLGGNGSTPPGAKVHALFADKFDDTADTVAGGTSENTFAGIAITTNALTAAQGTWQYSANGTDWTDLPPVTIATALLLKTTDSLRFVPAPHFNGVPGDLTVRLIDDSVTFTTGDRPDLSNDTTKSGGSTGFSDSSNAVTLSTSVTAINDRPTTAETMLAATTEDNVNPSGAKVAELGFSYSDTTDDQTGIVGGEDWATDFGGIAIVGNLADSTTQGVWQYNDGSGWVTIGSGGSAPTDSVAVLLPTTASLRFLPTVTHYNGTPGNLVVRVSDAVVPFNASTSIVSALGSTSHWSETTTLDTSVLPQNDAPVLTATASNPIVTENNTTGNDPSINPILLLNAGVDLFDLDLSTTAALTDDTFGAGTITVTLTDGIVGDVVFVDTALQGIGSTAGGTATTPLVISLADTATVDQVEAILAALQYRSTSDNPTLNDTDTTRSYTIVVNDRNNLQTNGNAGGPDALAATTINGIITISATTNDPPIVDLNSGTTGANNSVNWVEGANVAHTAVKIAGSATLADYDNTQMTQMVITVGNVMNGDAEVLNIGSKNFQLAMNYTNETVGSFTVSYASSTGTFTIVPASGATAPLSDTNSFQTLLQGITYINTTDTPTAGARTFNVTVTDAGLDNAGTNGTESSNTPVSTLNVIPANDQPRLTNLNVVSFHENSIQVKPDWLDQDITLTELDSNTYTNGTITISGLVAADIVSLPTTSTAALGNVQRSGIDVQYYDGSNWITVGTASGGTASSFKVTLKANATPIIAERIIENLTFQNTSNAPTPTRTLTYTVNDGSTGGIVQGATLGVTIIRDNDSPSMSATTLGGTYVEGDSTGLQLINGTIIVSDLDTPTSFNGGSLTVHLDTYVSGDTLSVLTQGTGTGQISVSGTTLRYANTVFATTSGGTGSDLVITFNSAATPLAVQALLARLRYSNTDNDNPTVNAIDPSREFAVTLNDGANTHDSGADDVAAKTAQLTGTIIITSTADAPVIIASNANFTEGGSAVTLSPGLTLSDVDDTQAVHATVQINTGLTAYDSLAVPGTAPENKIAGTSIEVSSYNPATGTLTLSGTGTLAQYQSALQSVTFNNSSEDPAGNALTGSRTIIWSVTDANSNAIGGIGATGATGTRTSTVTLYPVNDSPTISGLDLTSSVLHIQGGAAVLIDSDVGLGDYELVARDNWAGAKLTIARVTGASTDDQFGASDNLTLSPENTVVLSGTQIGTYTQYNGILTVNFTTSATTAGVIETLQRLTYRNTQTAPGSLNYNSVSLRVTIDDQNTDITGSGTAGTTPEAQQQGSGGYKSSFSDITVNINRLPIANADTASINEGIATTDITSVTGDLTPDSTSDGNVRDTDQDGDTLAVQGVAAGDVGGMQSANLNDEVDGTYGTINVSSSGIYTYTVDNTKASVQSLAEDESLNDVFTYTIGDGGGGFSTGTVTITITGTNDVPLVEVNNVTGAITEMVTPSGDLTDSGTIAFTDVDLNDIHTISSVALSSGALGSLTANLSTDTTGSGVGGLITWNYSVAASSVEYLGEGQTKVEQFTLQIDDGHGGVIDRTITVTITGANDTPVAAHDTDHSLDGRPVTIAVLDNGTDFEGNPLTVSNIAGVRVMSSDTYNSYIHQTIPFSPAMFVHQTVEIAQQERMNGDSLSFSNPDMVRLGDIESHSIGADLGLDPAVFVQKAVRDSQAQGEFIDNIVNGRLTRLSLSSDRLIPTPELSQPDPLEIIPPSRFVEMTDITEHDVLPENDMESAPPVIQSTTAGRPLVNSWAAPSFSEQIRTAGGYGPIADSGTFHQRFNLKHH